MPLIKPRTRGKAFARLNTRLERETNETLYAYAEFLGEPVEYVLNELIDTILAKDKEFVLWRAEHPQSWVPSRRSVRMRKARSAAAVSRDGGAGGPTRPMAASA